MNPVTRFEVPFKEAARASPFNENVFDWGLKPLGEEMDNYIFAIADVKPGAPAGAINGGLYHHKEDCQLNIPHL